MMKGKSYPQEFTGFAKNAAMVVRIIGQKFPGNPADLPLFSNDNSKVVLVSSPPPTLEDKALSGVGGIATRLEVKLCTHVQAAFEKLAPPPFDVGRFPDVISNYAQYRLLQAWDHVQALQPAYGAAEAQRSSSPALHLGVWERYTKKPIITGYSRQIDAPRERWQEMHQRILKHLGRQLAEYPNFDFGSVITTVACKEGGSEKIHLDWFDNLNLFAWVTAVGDFQGANFCTPQLGGQMVSKPGSVLGTRTRFLAHCCTPISGRRIVFTFFIDSCLFERTMCKLN
ncbi:hypothetical protein B0H19DRAFT_993576 [Mycena capillaripes]|nr:hypothetical protein B0H19DRAFT_993576 [Mycena capillaripes]